MLEGTATGNGHCADTLSKIAENEGNHKLICFAYDNAVFIIIIIYFSFVVVCVDDGE